MAHEHRLSKQLNSHEPSSRKGHQVYADKNRQCPTQISVRYLTAKGFR